MGLRFCALFFLLLLNMVLICEMPAQSIEEKKQKLVASQIPPSKQSNKIDGAMQKNLSDLQELRDSLEQLHMQAQNLYRQNAEESKYIPLLAQIQDVKAQIAEKQKQLRKKIKNRTQRDDMASWHHPAATIEDFVLEYGGDVIYLIPPAIAEYPLKVLGSLPVPKQIWPEMLQWIFTQNGIGIRSVNPYLKQLFLLRQDGSKLELVTNKSSLLSALPAQWRICFVLTPDVSKWNVIHQTLQTFYQADTTQIHTIGQHICIVGTVENVQELLKISDFLTDHQQPQEYSIVELKKLLSNEVKPLLQAIYNTKESTLERQTTDENKIGFSKGLQVFDFKHRPQVLCLIGQHTEIESAKQTITKLEQGMQDPKEKMVFWYTCRYSSAHELACTLERVYQLMQQDTATSIMMSQTVFDTKAKEYTKKEEAPSPFLSVSPQRFLQNKKDTIFSSSTPMPNFFVVDPKSSAIIMVIEQQYHPKIEQLAKRLDVPKKMVQIEVLLFEKKIKNSNRIGLNLLRFGKSFNKNEVRGMRWKDSKDNTNGKNEGILKFVFGSTKHGRMPAYDLAYQFLITQDDIQINASPSVITINQTPAYISIVNESSIDMGKIIDKKSSDAISYARAEYGTNLKITPIIHADEQRIPYGSKNTLITLQTEIDFEDVHSTKAEFRPEVTKRRIRNEVCIANGQTVILGGLRNKTLHEDKQMIPFLGEIPGIGKLFSETGMSNDSTEMFIFLTPKIVDDPATDLEIIKFEQLSKRPGDTPSFLKYLTVAQEQEKRKLFYNSLQMLLGAESSTAES